MSNAINPLMEMVQEGKLAGTGASHYNALGRELDGKLYEAVKAILEEAIDDNGAIDIRMFAYIANNAVSDVTLEKLF